MIKHTNKRAAINTLSVHSHSSQLSQDKHLSMHRSSMVNEAACADAVLWGPGGDAHSLPTDPAWQMLWLPSIQRSIKAAWAVTHCFSRTCEQSVYWCVTGFLALQCGADYRSWVRLPCDDFVMCLCAHPSCLMHAAEMC